MPRCIIAIVEGVEEGELRKAIRACSLGWWSQSLNTSPLLPLNCGPVPYEPSNLATAFSGLDPGHHGCFSYWGIRSGVERPKVLTSSDVRVPRVWQWPELADLRFGIVNVQLTHPPQQLNGLMVSYLMEQSLRCTYPVSLQRDLSQQGLRCAQDVSAFYRGEATEAFSAEVFRIAQFQLDTALALGEEVDVLIVNLTVADRVSHFLWSEIEYWQQLTGLPNVLKAYQFIDAALSQLESTLPDNGNLMVFTEIGFGPLTRFVSLDDMLQVAGLQHLREDGEVDEKRSLAREAVQGSHGIIVLHRNSAGAISSEHVEQIRNVLLAMRFNDGQPVLSTACRSEEVYSGPNVDLAPDIIVTPHDPARPPLGDPRWARHVHRHLQTGWHRDRGFVLVRGAQTVELEGSADLARIAPTIVRMMDREPPAWCAPALVA